MDDETRKLLEEAMKHADPAMLEKFGNPLDENDPRMWTPTKRIENGVSLEDQVTYLGLDVEAHAVAMATLMQDLAEMKKVVTTLLTNQVTTMLKDDPEKAVQMLMGVMGGQGSKGPSEDLNYAGSSRGLAPGDQVQTPNGAIRADQIPGYRNDPDWKPSPDWVDANCMCSTHQAMRKASDNYDPFNLNPKNEDPPTGMYL